MLQKLDAVLKANHGKELIPVYMDESLYIKEKENHNNYNANFCVILKSRVFLQKYPDCQIDDAQYVIVFLTKPSDDVFAYCLEEMEYFLNEKYEVFIEHNDAITGYEYDESTQNIYVSPLEVSRIKPYTAFDRVATLFTVHMATQYGTPKIYHRIMSLSVELSQFIQNRYSESFTPGQMNYAIGNVTMEYRRRLEQLMNAQHWDIPITSMVPGVIMDYAVASILGFKTLLSNEYGFLVQYSEEWLVEIYKVWTEKNGTKWCTFNPSTNEYHNKYAIQMYGKDKSETWKTVVTLDQLKTWVGWSEKYNDDSDLILWAKCATLLLNTCQYNEVLDGKSIAIPEVVLRHQHLCT